MKLRHSKNKELVKAANNFQPWDYGFLLDLEKEALTRMLEYYSEGEDLIPCDKRTLRYVKIALKLLDIVLEKDTSIHCNFLMPESKRWVSIKYVNSRNWHRFFPENENADSLILKDELRKEKAWYLYNLIRYREGRHWWT